MLNCKLCKSRNVKIFYTEYTKEKEFNYIYCLDCDLYQLLEIYDGGKATRRMLNLNETHGKILNLMGKSYEQMYFLKRGCGR